MLVLKFDVGSLLPFRPYFKNYDRHIHVFLAFILLSTEDSVLKELFSAQIK